MARSNIERLPRGQLPIEELAQVENVKDVRSLRFCPVCGAPGNTYTMVDLDGLWFHGRCFAERYGEGWLFALPKLKTDRLTLGDLGTHLMRRLINNR